MALLEAENVEVRFGGVRAVADVDLHVEAGTITGLIGPNGAGKTTLFNVICGLQAIDSGRVVLDGTDITKVKAHGRARLGIARTFQRLEVFASMTARENILVAAEIRRQWSRDRSDPAVLVEEIIDLIGIGSVADRVAGALPTGVGRLVELGRALAAKPRVVLLDEPSSGLDEQESDAFADLVVRLAGEGLAVLLVEHDVDLVMRVCSVINVLDFGSVLAVGTPSDIQRDAGVRAAYLGEGDAVS